MGWFYLSIAIVFEVVGTTQLKRTEGNFFTTAGMLMLLFYAISFFMLTLALKNDIEVGVGYAIWSGVGTALIAIIGVMAFNEQATMMKFLCVGMIIIGVVGLKLDTEKRKLASEPTESEVNQEEPFKKSEIHSEREINLPELQIPETAGSLVTEY